MSVAARAQIGVKQAVPFFWVTDIERSICFYSDGLGFEVKNKWIDNGKLRWCWLQYGGAALMLQEFLAEKVPTERRGVGVSVCFQCDDALAFYRDVRSRGIAASNRSLEMPCG